MNHMPPPRWDLRNVYPSLESPEFEAAVQSLRTMNDDLENYLQTAEIIPEDKMIQSVIMQKRDFGSEQS